MAEEIAVQGEGTEGVAARLPGQLTKSFEGSDETIYRIDRASGQNCPCECVEQHGIPVADVRAVEGTLYLVFHVNDQDAIRSIVESIREYYQNVAVSRLVQSVDDVGLGSLVFVDKGKLTDRQLEVLEVAHTEGYFEHPRRANAGEIASALGITTSTFIEHLSAAQRKILDSILTSGS